MRDHLIHESWVKACVVVYTLSGVRTVLANKQIRSLCSMELLELIRCPTSAFATARQE